MNARRRLASLVFFVAGLFALMLFIASEQANIHTFLVGVLPSFLIALKLLLALLALATGGGLAYGVYRFRRHIGALQLQADEESERVRAQTLQNDIIAAHVQAARTIPTAIEIAMQRSQTMEYADGYQNFRTSLPSPAASQVRMVDAHQNERALLPDPRFSIPQAVAFPRMLENLHPGTFCLGYGQNGAIYGAIDDLLSTAIVGRPGTGKTTLLRFVCAQVLYNHGIPVLFDPHGNIIDDLQGIVSCYEDTRAIDEESHKLIATVDKRLEKRRRGLRTGKPILLLADEWPIVSEMSNLAKSAMRRLVLEGRKVGMFALISGQGLPAALLNGSLVRDALSSRYVFNTTPQQARMAGMDNETAKSLLGALDTAGAGFAILASARLKPQIVSIPNTTAQDIHACRVRYSDRERSSVPGVPGRSSHVPERPPAWEAVPDVPDVPEKEAFPIENVSQQEREQVISLAIEQGIPRREICKALGKGNAYYPVVKAILDEYEEGKMQA